MTNQSRLGARRQMAMDHEQMMGWSRWYPDNPMVDEGFIPGRGMHAAIKAFKAARPFRMEPDAFLEAARALLGALSDDLGIPAPTVIHSGPWSGCSGTSRCDITAGVIDLHGRPSVITLLHEFAHYIGYGETGAVWWSVNIFRLYWPVSFSRLKNEPGTHVLTK